MIEDLPTLAHVGHTVMLRIQVYVGAFWNHWALPFQALPVIGGASDTQLGRIPESFGRQLTGRAPYDTLRRVPGNRELSFWVAVLVLQVVPGT